MGGRSMPTSTVWRCILRSCFERNARTCSLYLILNVPGLFSLSRLVSSRLVSSRVSIQDKGRMFGALGVAALSCLWI